MVLAIAWPPLHHGGPADLFYQGAIDSEAADDVPEQSAAGFAAKVERPHGAGKQAVSADEVQHVGGCEDGLQLRSQLRIGPHGGVGIRGDHLAFGVGQRKQIVAADVPFFDRLVLNSPGIVGGHQSLEAGQVGQQRIFVIECVQPLALQILKRADGALQIAREPVRYLIEQLMANEQEAGQRGSGDHYRHGCDEKNPRPDTFAHVHAILRERRVAAALTGQTCSRLHKW
jgi:hypothetical protein